MATSIMDVSDYHPTVMLRGDKGEEIEVEIQHLGVDTIQMLVTRFPELKEMWEKRSAGGFTAEKVLSMGPDVVVLICACGTTGGKIEDREKKLRKRPPGDWAKLLVGIFDATFEGVGPLLARLHELGLGEGVALLNSARRSAGDLNGGGPASDTPSSTLSSPASTTDTRGSEPSPTPPAS